MAKKTVTKNTSELIKIINNAILEKKGEDVVNISLRKLENSVAEDFIICTGGSNTMARTIAQFIEKEVKENLGEKAWKKEGYDNSEWILLDIVNVVVHVFQPEAREFYKLDKLWADGEKTLINN
jgi:ribosome-associated protein